MGVGRVLFNPPFHKSWRVKENPPYASLASDLLIRNRNSGLRAVLRNCSASVRCSEFLQDDDLLPYPLRKSGADALDIADHFGDRLVLETLPEQHRHLRGQRQHLRTIVEIPCHLKFVELKGRRRRRIRANGKLARVLGQLMHVNHMDDGAKLVQRRQRTAALEAFFQLEQGEYRGPCEDCEIGCCLDALCGRGNTIGRRVGEVDQRQHPSQDRYARRYRGENEDTQPDVAAADADCASRIYLRDYVELRAEPVKPAIAESLEDTCHKPLNRLDHRAGSQDQLFTTG